MYALYITPLKPWDNNSGVKQGWYNGYKTKVNGLIYKSPGMNHCESHGSKNTPITTPTPVKTYKNWKTLLKSAMKLSRTIVEYTEASRSIPTQLFVSINEHYCFSENYYCPYKIEIVNLEKMQKCEVFPNNIAIQLQNPL